VAAGLIGPSARHASANWPRRAGLATAIGWSPGPGGHRRRQEGDAEAAPGQLHHHGRIVGLEGDPWREAGQRARFVQTGPNAGALRHADQLTVAERLDGQRFLAVERIAVADHGDHLLVHEDLQGHARIGRRRTQRDHRQVECAHPHRVHQPVGVVL
jgi:hypothetical protein